MRLIAWIPALAAICLAVPAGNTSGPGTGLLGNATVVNNNPIGKMYMATLPEVEFFDANDPRGNVKGSVIAIAHPNGTGIDFQVTFSNLPTSGGPFPYHIHNLPVPDNGNCTETQGHLDPFERGQDPPCDATLPQTCQVGDLSGKYGKIDSDPFTVAYTDLYASTIPDLGSFFGNRSFVIHFDNSTRITCGNFALLGNTSEGGGPATSPANNSTPVTGSALMNHASMLPVLVTILLSFMI
ncbi:superoxide dismutase [Xylogone sp. PMI_703]|nr:superoxide dismutase [Xylogone sp. PMI_703]